MAYFRISLPCSQEPVIDSCPDSHVSCPHYSPGDESAPNRNEYLEYFPWGKGGRCVGLTTLPPSYADCLEIWEPHHRGALRACPGL